MALGAGGDPALGGGGDPGGRRADVGRHGRDRRGDAARAGPELSGLGAPDIELRLLARDLVESTGRVSDLVGATKAYRYMDQDLARQEIDVHQGVISTLVILNHRWTEKSVRIVRAFGELPRLQAYGSELNQVWTNLPSNAIDAVGEGGTVTVRTRHDPHAGVVCVDIEDDGPGVPAELQTRIFEPFFTTKGEPFFTTKGVREGTGMGLDIANRTVRQRHLGTLTVHSEPGHTVFQVRLPINPDGAGA